MYMNVGYYQNSRLDFKDTSRPLIVGSCGNYRLTTAHHKLPTYRPRGRLDYQIIYIASGKGYFHFGDEADETVVPAGHMVLYRPREFQKYEYFGEDATEVYWVHFTGSQVKDILRKYAITDDMRILKVGISPDYERAFNRIILELQQCQNGYEAMIELVLHQLLITLNRKLIRKPLLKNEYLEGEMTLASRYFYDHYYEDISIEAYAASRGMSVSWFIRNFKACTGSTPMQYILSIRMTNAQMLLENTTDAVNEIARIVGYDNALYFSRLFKKTIGISPSRFRESVRG